jgi:hypothetical protein
LLIGLRAVAPQLITFLQPATVCKKAHEDMNSGLQMLERSVFPKAPWRVEVVLAGQAADYSKTPFRNQLAHVLGTRQVGTFEPKKSVPGLVVIYHRPAMRIDPIAITFTTPASVDGVGNPCQRVFGRNALAEFLIEAFKE